MLPHGFQGELYAFICHQAVDTVCPISHMIIILCSVYSWMWVSPSPVVSIVYMWFFHVVGWCNMSCCTVHCIYVSRKGVLLYAFTKVWIVFGMLCATYMVCCWCSMMMVSSCHSVQGSILSLIMLLVLLEPVWQPWHSWENFTCFTFHCQFWKCWQRGRNHLRTSLYYLILVWIG